MWKVIDWVMRGTSCGAWCLVPGAWCLVPGAWCLIPGDYWPELRIDQSSLGLFSRHCIVFLGKEACSHSVFPPRSRNRHQKLSENSTNCWGRKGRGLQRISMGGGGEKMCQWGQRRSSQNFLTCNRASTWSMWFASNKATLASRADAADC